MTHEDALAIINSINHLSEVIDANLGWLFILGCFFLLFKKMGGK